MPHALSLSEFVEKYHSELAAEVLARTPPVYNYDGARFAATASALKRRLFPAQFHAAAAIATRLGQDRSALLVGEAGVGKTITAIAAASFIGAARVLVVCPAHLVLKWQREVLSTVRGARVHVLRRVADADAALALAASPTSPLYCILPRDIAKLGSPWRPAIRTAYLRVTPGPEAAPVPLLVPVRDETAGRADILRSPDSGTPVVVYICTSCGGVLARPGTESLEKRLWGPGDIVIGASCASCGEPVWQYDRTPGRRPIFPLARYLARRYPRVFDLLIVDEAHQYKARGTAQGMALTDLSRAAERTLSLTATLMNGKASSIFYILHRTSPQFRAAWPYTACGRFVRSYGLVETGREQYEEVVVSRDGRVSKRLRTRTTARELPGVSPAILRWVLDSTAFIRLRDLGISLPPYREHAVQIPMLDDQAEAYRRLESGLRKRIAGAYRERRVHLLGSYLQALLSWPDAPWRGEGVADPCSGEIVASAPALPAGVLYPKEQTLVSLCSAARAEGRKTLVYCTHTQTRDITERLRAVLAGAGLRAEVLRASVPPANRERWIAERAAGLDVLITSPRLVGEGLDLVQFSTVVWYEPEYSTYVVRQASRRVWRIGQTRPVDVYFLIYDETVQKPALALVASGIRAASMVDGDVLPDETIAADLDLGRTDFFARLAKTVLEKADARDPAEILAEVEALERKASEIIGPHSGDPLGVPVPLVPGASVTTIRVEQVSLF
jgi:superfamily II DNA or RNA helicase